MPLIDRVKLLIRDVPDFPKPGILFKDLTPLLEQPDIVRQVVENLADPYKDKRIDAIAAIEARGFLFGFLLAQRLQIPFIPVRKEGKLPYKKISQQYMLEYGSALVEMHEDAISPGWNVVVHDDLLATGGTADAASKLIRQLGGEVAGFCFVVNLGFLGGETLLKKHYNCDIHYIIKY